MSDWRGFVASLLVVAGVVAFGWVMLGLAIRLILGPLAGLLALLTVTVQP